MFSIRFNDAPDLALEVEGEAFTCNHMTTARRRATEVATETERAVLIYRGDRPTLVIRPDGGAEPPKSMKAEDCKAGPGKPACFCVNCRAARRRA